MAYRNETEQLRARSERLEREVADYQVRIESHEAEIQRLRESNAQLQRRCRWLRIARPLVFTGVGSVSGALFSVPVSNMSENDGFIAVFTITGALFGALWGLGHEIGPKY